MKSSRYAGGAGRLWPAPRGGWNVGGGGLSVCPGQTLFPVNRFTHWPGGGGHSSWPQVTLG